MKVGCSLGFIGSQDTSTPESRCSHLNDTNRPSSTSDKTLQVWSTARQSQSHRSHMIQSYFSRWHNLRFSGAALGRAECRRIQITSISLPLWKYLWRRSRRDAAQGNKIRWRCICLTGKLTSLTWIYSGSGLIRKNFQPVHKAGPCGWIPVYYISTASCRTGGPGQTEASIAESDPGTVHSFLFLREFCERFDI